MTRSEGIISANSGENKLADDEIDHIISAKDAGINDIYL
jgi:hypothetical protein